MITDFEEVNNLLDADAATLTDGSDADGLHIHQKLDNGGANEITAAEARTHFDNAAKHRLIDDGTPSLTTLLSGTFIQNALDALTASLGSRILPGVQDNTALKTIDTTVAADFPDKTLILSEDEGLYALDRQSVASEDLPRIVTPTVGVGRWLRLSVPLSDHNSTTNKQGGTTNEFFHLTSSQHTTVLTDLPLNTTHRGLTNNPHSVTGSQVGITIGNTQVSFGNASNGIVGNSGFTFDGTNLKIPNFLTTPSAIHIGPGTPTGKGAASISIGIGTGTNQGSNATSYGNGAGGIDQGSSASAYGSGSGQLLQGNGASSYGNSSGMENQAPGASAFGKNAGKFSQGNAAISLGLNSGENFQAANGIIISATGITEDNTVAGHIVIKSSLADLTYDGLAWAFTGGDVNINDTLKIGGGLQQAVTIITAATYTILKTDFMIFADTTTQDITLTLPAIVSGSVDDGRIFRVQKIFDNTNSLTITPQAPSIINGETTDTISGLKNDKLTYMASNGDWFIINRDTNTFGIITQDTPGTTQGLTLTLAKLAVFDTDAFATPGVLDADSSNDVITVDHSENLSLGGDGFKIEFMVEISNYSNNQEIFCEIFIDGVASNIQDVQQTSNAFNTVLSASGVRRILAAQDIELRISASNISTATFETCELIVERLVK